MASNVSPLRITIPYRCPASDPAGLKGLSPEAAFKKLFTEGKGTFISRGDGSGTHSGEKAIWKAAGYDYETQVAEGWRLVY